MQVTYGSGKAHQSHKVSAKQKTAFKKSFVGKIVTASIKGATRKLAEANRRWDREHHIKEKAVAYHYQSKSHQRAKSEMGTKKYEAQYGKHPEFETKKSSKKTHVSHKSKSYEGPSF